MVEENKKEMSDFSTIIYNELNYITNRCINQNININSFDNKTLAILSENIGMIYLGIIITYLEHYGLIKERDGLIEDWEVYVRQLYGENAPHNEALGKVLDIAKFFKARLVPNNEQKTINNWSVWIREILSRPNKKAVGEMAAFFTLGLYDVKKMSDELIEHIKVSMSIIKQWHKTPNNPRE